MKLAKYVQARSIRSRVMLVIMATVGATLLVGYGSLLFYDIAQSRHALIFEAETLGEIVAERSAYTLAFRDPEAANSNLEALASHPSVSAAAILDDTGMVFASYTRDGGSADFPPPNAWAADSFFRDDALWTRAVIVASGQVVGHTVLRVEQERLRQRAAAATAIVLTVLAASLLLALVVSASLRRIITAPVLHLVDVARSLTLADTVSGERAKKSGITELDVLADAFNAMLGRIEQRDEVLRQTNDDLKQENAERRRAEISLRDSQALLQAVIDNSSAIIYAKDLEGRFMLVNRGLEELTPLSREEIIGKTDYEIFSRELADAYRANDLLVIEQNRPIERDEQASQRDGVHTYISLKFPLRDANGNPEGICGISTDITARVRVEQHRDQLLLDEQRARAEAEEAIRLRDEFLQIASHELRTPLTSLQLSIQTLGKKLLPGTPGESTRALFAITGRQLERLNNLVEMLLDVSRIQAGRLELDRAPVDLRELVDDVVDQLGEVLARSGTTISVHAEQPVIGFWDAPRIEQVVTNLLTNAIKFGQHVPIEVSVTAEDGVAHLVVTDHGIGIPPEVQPQLFQRFGRGVSSRNYGGLGLGLYITRTIVEAHGGHVRLTSKVGQGSTFCVELPLSS